MCIWGSTFWLLLIIAVFFFNRSFLTPGSVLSLLSEKLDCIKHFMQEKFCQNFHRQSFQEETWNLQLLKCRGLLIWGAEEHQRPGLVHNVQTLNKCPLVVSQNCSVPCVCSHSKALPAFLSCAAPRYTCLERVWRGWRCAGAGWLPVPSNTAQANLMCCTLSRNSWDLIGSRSPK